MERTLGLARGGDFEAAAQMVRRGEGQQVMDSARALLGTLRNAEFASLQERRAREAATSERTIVLVLFGSLLAVAIVAASRQSLVRELYARERAEATLELNERSLRALYTIASSQELDYEAKLKALAEMGAKRFGLSTGVLARVRGARYTVEAVYDATGKIRQGDVHDLADTYCAHALEGSGPLALRDAAAEGWKGRRCYDAFGLAAYLGMPVREGGEVYGTLAFSDPRPREAEFTDSDKDFLRLIAQWIGGELERREAAKALRQREERYRVVVESAGDVIFTTDPAGRVTYANPAAARVTGYDPGRLREMHTLDLVAPEQRGELREALERQVREQRSTAYYEVPVLTRDGRELWLGQNVQVLRSDDGRLSGMQVVARDITRQLEVERMKDEFLSVVSHELRTPLTSIRGSLGLLASGRMGTLDERGQRMLEIAVQSTDRLVRLINDLLDIEKIESGQAEMEREPVELRHLAAEAVEAMQPLAERAGVTLDAEVAGATLLADPDRILQVLTNLLSNAVKFSSPGGVVSLAGRVQDGEALVSVRDRGRGIPADKLEAIFERFQQVDSSDARQKGGTGLGLAIVRSIVQQHGGTIRVESEWGAGSTFVFTLPLHRPAPAAQEVAPHYNVLLVEDDVGLAGVLGESLRERGLSVCHATAGGEAIDLSRRITYDLLLLDPGLPEVDGWELVDWLRRHNRHRNVPVLVYTASDLDDDMRERLRLGPTEFMTKTRTPLGQLEERIAALLDRTAAREPTQE